jgi:hypothetical protein
MVVNETVMCFESEYNLGKETGKDLLQYCRLAVERYFFSKLYDKIFAMYVIKNEIDDNLFQERGRLIKKMSPLKVLGYLGVG